MVYLDNAATTFPKPEAVYKALDRANRELAVNAGRGSYHTAKEASEMISHTKSLLLKLFNAEGYADIVFTPSVTHAFNQIIHGAGLKEGDTVYMTPYEHNAVARTVAEAEKRYRVAYRLLPLKEDLSIDTEKLEYMFSQERPAMVICTAVSNVTGYVLPVKDIFSAAKRYGAVTVTDAAQAAGLIDMDQGDLQADIIAFAGHKTLYGPFGIGGFSIKKGVELGVVLTGGTGSDSLNLDMPEVSPARYEAASPNIVAVCGLNAALRCIGIEEHYRTVHVLTEYLVNRLKDIEGVKLVGLTESGFPLGIVSVIVEGYRADEVGMILDEDYGIAVRTGYHCAPFIHKYLKDEECGGTVRIGVGQYNTKEDIDALTDAIESL